MLKDEILSMGMYTGERLEEEVERFLVKHGETVLDNTEVCILRQLVNPANQCNGCPSFMGCKKKYMMVVAVATLPVTLMAEIPSKDGQRICKDALKVIERILRARTDEELGAIVPDI